MIAGAMVALAVAVAVFVLAPLREPQVPARGEGDDKRRQEEDVASLALRDLELDRAMGKLSTEDYQDLRSRYKPSTPEGGPL
jgi:hypothetical protein